jgi:PAS domain S-box-containing protein
MNGQQLAAAAAQAIQQQGRGRKKSQAQIDRRRERNRILARRTRLRKKFFFESLQKDVMDLQQENMRLKGIVKEEIDNEDGKKILDECDAVEKMPPSVMEAIGETQNGMDSHDFSLVQSIQNSQHAFIITDPSLTDNPIVYASDDFLELTGYARDQVLGRNCRFLQGTDTSKESVEEISKALENGEDVSVTMLNYMADGTPFWNRLFIAALRDAQNSIVNFIGVIVKVPSPEEDEPDDGNVLSTEANEDDAKQNASENTIQAIEGSVSPAVAASAGGQ